MIHTFPNNENTQILCFQSLSDNPAAMFLSVAKGFIVSTFTGQHAKNSHRLATLHFSFCVADKPSYPYAGLAECARRVSVNSLNIERLDSNKYEQLPLEANDRSDPSMVLHKAQNTLV